MGTENSEVLRGTLDMLILKTLSLAPLHGWGICERIQQVSGDALRVGQGSLYASLHRLTREGWIRSYWADTENGRRARYYQLTRAGERQLKVEADHWERLALGVARVMSARSI
jgi:transcriptional regulator